MKSVLVLCFLFSLVLAAPNPDGRASTGLPCLSDEVFSVVGDDPNFQKWFKDVEKSVNDLWTLYFQCESVPLIMKPWCYNHVVEIGNAWFNNAVGKLTEIDPSRAKTWEEIAQTCNK